MQLQLTVLDNSDNSATVTLLIPETHINKQQHNVKPPNELYIFNREILFVFFYGMTKMSKCPPRAFCSNTDIYWLDESLVLGGSDL